MNLPKIPDIPDIPGLSKLPKDPAILLSYINTQLRDKYDSLKALCDDMGITESDIKAVLEKAGFKYDELKNRFK